MATNTRKALPIGESALSLPALVAEAILQDILKGTLAPGTRLTETALAEHHVVSRSTVREALAQLERNHFIERLPRFGARVVEVDTAETEELFEIRSALLSLGASRACRFASDDQMRMLDDKAAVLERLAASDSTAPTDYSHCVYELQSFLVELGRSRWLTNLYEQISEQTVWRATVRHRGVGFADAERRRQSSKDWRSLVDAVRSRNEAASASAGKALVGASLAYFRTQFPGANMEDVDSDPK